MSRNILPSAIDYLSTTTSIRIAHLVQLELPSSTDAFPVYDYLTDYGTEVVWDGKAYSPDRVVKVGDVRQGTLLTNYKLKIDIAGEYQSELDRALNDSGETSFVGKKIRVLRAYLDSDGNIIPFDADSNGPMELFFGNVSSTDINDGVVSGNSTVSWQCAGIFEDFDLVNGRVTDDATHRGLESVTGTSELQPGSGAKKEAYKTDTGFQHANQTINVISKYTTTEKRYKMKSSFFGLKSKLKEYEVEVEKELELGVDLAAQYLPFVRGVRRVAGIPVFLDNAASNPSLMYVVYALCEGPATLLNLFIDGESTICVSEDQQETDMCLGNQQNGDTLSKYLREDGGYQNLHQSYAPRPVLDYVRSELGTIPNRNPIPPSIPTTNALPAEQGIKDARSFTITNSAGTKKFWYHPGSSDQAANSQLMAISAEGNFLGQVASGAGSEYWDSNSRLLDTAYLVLQMEITEEEQEIPEIEAVVESHRHNGSTEQVTLNPADHLRDYMTSSSFGGGLNLNELDTASFDYVRNVYNSELTSYNKQWATYWRYIGWQDLDSHTPKLLECNTLVKTEETVTKNIEGILSQMDATLNQLGGKYHLSIEDDSDPIADIDITEVIGSVKTTDTSSKGKWNAISANLIDPAMSWSANKLVFFDSEYLNQDKGVQKKGNVTFQHITNYYVARNWAKRQLDKSRFAREVTFKTYHKYIYLYPNANVTFTYPRFGWDKKKVRVKSMTMLSDGTVSLTLVETSSTIYSDIDDTQIDIPSIPSNNIPRPNNLRVVSPEDPNYNFPEGADNIYGYLLWDPYEGSNLLRYEIEDWNYPSDYTRNIAVPYNRTIAHTTTGKLSVFYPITGIEINKEYTFKVKTVDLFGNFSKYAVYTKTFTSGDLPSTYSAVTGFRATNTDSNGNYIGSSVSFTWNLHPSAEIDSYIIAIVDENSLAELGQFTIPATTQEDCTFEFTIADNMSIYANNTSGSVGAYRDYNAKIRGVASNANTAWVYLEEE